MWRLAIVLLCMTIGVVQAQVPATAADLNAATQATPSSTATPLSPLIGKWKGDWASSTRASGQMEIEVSAVDGDSVTGQVRATSDSRVAGGASQAPRHQPCRAHRQLTGADSDQADRCVRSRHADSQGV